MGTGWIGLGQPAADDRRLAASGERARSPRGTRIRPAARRDRDSLPVAARTRLARVATTPEDAASAYALRPVARVALAAHRLGVSGACVVFTSPEKELRLFADQRRLGQPRPSGLERASCSTS